MLSSMILSSTTTTRVASFRSCSSSSSSSSSRGKKMLQSSSSTSMKRASTTTTNFKRLTEQIRGRRSAILIKSGNGDDTLKNLESLLPEDDSERLQKEREREAEEKYKEKQEQKRSAEDLASAIKNQEENKKNTFTTGDDGEYDFAQKSIAALCYMLPLLDSLKYSKFLLIQIYLKIYHLRLVFFLIYFFP